MHCGWEVLTEPRTHSNTSSQMRESSIRLFQPITKISNIAVKHPIVGTPMSHGDIVLAFFNLTEMETSKDMPSFQERDILGL